MKRSSFVAALLLAAPLSARGATRTLTVSMIQAKVDAIISRTGAAYAEAPNKLAAGAATHARAHDMCALMVPVKGQVHSWAGVVTRLDSTSSGAGILAIQFGTGAFAETESMDLGPLSDGTLLKPGSPVFNAATTLSVGEKVTFSGHFFPSKATCFKEMSLTTDEMMRHAHYEFLFTAIAPLATTR